MADWRMEPPEAGAPALEIDFDLPLLKISVLTGFYCPRLGILR